jgi:alpha-beta hydrolase superfamily lysophospholipase
MPPKPTLFLAGVAAIALHVADDNFIHPEAGTSVGEHLVSGLVPLALLGLAAWAYPRLRGGYQGLLAIMLGILGIVGGVEAVHYTSTVGASGDDYTGLLSIPAGLLLIGVGATTLWQTRRVTGNRPWRYGRRALLAFGAFAGLSIAMVPLAVGYITTHTGRSVVPANHLGVAYENVSFETSDGLTLRGWYIPSRTGAAVISFPGRNGSQKPARFLARHGYGVLLFDRRGEGRSEGKPNAWGWRGTKDIDAAIRFLERRPDVDPGRIGGIGLSVGGEMMLEEAARNHKLAAVVSDGAGARTLSEDMDQLDVHGLDKALGTIASGIKTASIAVFANSSPPGSLKRLTPEIDAPVLLIAAPNSPQGEKLNRVYARAGGENVALWEIPEARHMGGYDARPQEYERRVVGFFDGALR